MARHKIKPPKDATVKIANFVNDLQRTDILMVDVAKYDVVVEDGKRKFTITIEQPVK